ncbi:hypothetical protein BT96DRAFT_923479 [Gymnopus androsaceus JB14]|uniref:Uncharacterized protein n=1 Tax=Gymnopus androsaceus JB14 TaxID=1447944 RepID=A0A6A4HBP1_9AGAR|nr:hypothetical protein BT96DRAFT_923479 [Gymnopus androsaceus JB14]
MSSGNRNSTQSSPLTEHTIDESTLGTTAFKGTLSRQQVKSLVEKYPFIFQGNNLPQPRLDGIKSLVDLNAAVNIVFGGTLVQYGSLSTAERGFESLCKSAVTLGGPATRTARTYQVPLQGHRWVIRFWQESWQEPSGSIYMEIYDPDSDAAVALSPEDFLLADSAGVCSSLQAIEEFRAGVRDPETGRMLGDRVARSVEKDTWVIVEGSPSRSTRRMSLQPPTTLL